MCLCGIGGRRDAQGLLQTQNEKMLLCLTAIPQDAELNGTGVKSLQSQAD